MAISQYQLVINNTLSNRAKDYTEPQMKDLLIDLQANILKNHNKKYAIHAFIHFYDKKENEVKKWLGNLDITSAWNQLDARYGDSKIPEILTSIYFTHDAYQYLNYNLKKFPESGAMPFSSNPQARLSLNKNLEENKLPLTNTIHAMLMLAGDDKNALLDQLEQLAGRQIKIFESNKREKRVRGRIGHTFIQWGERKQIGLFGFVDGLSNPLFFPNLNKPNNIPEEEIARLESVLIKDPNGDNWNSCGSFLAFLKLRQDVDAFENGSQKVKNATGSSSDMAKAYIVGKLPNQNADICLSKMKGCPLHKSHIQAARCGIAETGRSQITRRSINYEDSKENQGLLFMSFQSNIGTQFEYLINRFFTNRIDGHVDPLLYDHKLKPSIDFHFPKTNLNATTAIQFANPFVTFQKGWYFFAPSISSIKKLSKG